MNDLISELKAIVGDKGLITEANDLEPYLAEERGLYRGESAIVVRPANTDEVAAVVKHCAERGIAMVPQGGNTGLCGGAVGRGGSVVISLNRMNSVRNVDPLNLTMTVEAGVILATVQAVAEDAGLLFPLTLGAEGSCHIGGNIATNAGGANVLRYGNTRDLVLGLEVVLPDGRIWNGLKALRKDNTGYDLKHLFMGAEGTLGIITAAVLKLFPRPGAKETAMIAVSGLNEAAQLFFLAKSSMGEALNAFELISHTALNLTVKNVEGIRNPFEGESAHYVLLEVTAPRDGEALRESLETMLGEAFEAGLAEDGVMAESESQSEALWRLRESIPEAQKIEGGSIKHDVAVPVSCIAEFLTEATAMVEAELPGIRVCAFGHFGDGNIHFNLTQPEGMDKAEYLAMWDHFNRLVHDLTMKMGGSFSAEHGIGQLKVGELKRYKDPIELDLMKTVKMALDPKGVMNPGKIVG